MGGWRHRVTWISRRPDGAGHVHTARLCLSRPAPEDASAHYEIHGDPAMNLHNPAGPTRDRADSEADLESWRADWAADGIGYSMAREECGGEVGGVRRSSAVLNLYCRFRAGIWGRRYAGELASAAISAARRPPPEMPVAAVVRPGNAASRRVAERAGPLFAGVVDRGGAPSELFLLKRP